MALKKRVPSFTDINNEEPEVSLRELPEFGSGTRPAPKKSAPTLPIIIIVLVVVVLGGIFLIGQNFNWWGSKPLKAVFLVNGQVYFGQIARTTSHDLYLDNVYYVQLQDQVQPGTTEGATSTTIQVPTLLKRGDELHQPYGAMQINRDQIVAIENVGKDSTVYKEIQQAESKK